MFYKIQACFRGVWFGLCAAVQTESEAERIKKVFENRGLTCRIVKTDDLC